MQDLADKLSRTYQLVWKTPEKPPRSFIEKRLVIFLGFAISRLSIRRELMVTDEISSPGCLSLASSALESFNAVCPGQAQMWAQNVHQV